MQINQLYEDPAPNKVLYCYGIDQPLYQRMTTSIPHLRFHRGIPTEETLDSLQEGHLIVLDDLADEVVHSKPIQNLIVMGCHHRKLSVIFVLHNLYEKGKVARTIALNSQYLVLFRNSRDMSQVHILGRQMFPRRPNRLIEAYEDATQLPRGYLLVDNTHTAKESYRLRTHIFPEEDPIIYIPKD